MNLFWQVTVVEFLLNIAVFSGAILAYGPIRILAARLPWPPGTAEGTAVGVLFGATTAMTVFLPIHFEGGAAIGCQTVLLALAAPLGGLYAALSAAVLAFAIELLPPWLSGHDPDFIAIASSMVSIAVGAAMYSLPIRKAVPGQVYFLQLPLLGALSAIGGPAAAWLLQGSAAALGSVLPALTSNVAAALILGTLLLHEKRRYEAERELRDNQVHLALQARELAAARDSAQAANRALASNLAMLRTQQELSPDGIMVVGKKGEILSYNQKLVEMWGLSEEALASGSALVVVRSGLDKIKDRDASIARLKRFNENPKEKSLDEIELKDGGIVDRYSAPMLGPDGEFLGRVWFYRDITPRKRAEAALARNSADLARQAKDLAAALQRAESASRAKSAFLANMSHELRTPLNAILGYAQLLQRDRGMGEHQRGAAQTIQQSGEHLLTLITDILDLSKIEAGKLELCAGTVDLRGFLQGVAEIIRIRAEEKALCFVFDAASGLPAFVHADDKRLRQVLLNLLGNAVKFTDRGQVGLQIALLSRSGDQVRLRLEVRDSGVGIDAHQLEAIFQPFEQVGETQRRSGGTGLGLSISRQLVRLMGGEIGVESKPGEGSRFFFELTLREVAAQAVTPASGRQATGYGGPRRSVLIVDDVAANRSVLADALRPLDFRISQAADGMEALEQAGASPPDLILMDTRMPVMDGMEATRRLRQFPALQSLPVIAVSAGATADDEAASIAAGANAFVTKPIVHERLLEEIGRQLGLDWLYEPLTQPVRVVVPEDLQESPPQDEMQRLHKLALAGNMRNIVLRAEHIGTLDTRYRPFAEQLQRLARAYQSKALLNFVEKHLEQKQGVS